MTKCILTGKTYPDYKPQQHRSINSARRNMELGLSNLDFLNAEQMHMAYHLYEAIQHLHQNRADEFKQKLHEINTLTFKGMFEPDDVCRNGKPIADCECC